MFFILYYFPVFPFKSALLITSKTVAVLASLSITALFEESEYWYDRLEKHLGWNSLGKVLCGGVMAIGDIKNKKELNDAYELGKSIN